MIRSGGSKQRWLIWIVILAMTITACAAPVEDAVATPSPSGAIEAQFSAVPDACQFRDESVVDYAEGAGQPTPEQALSLWPPDERPPGEPTMIRKNETTVIWMYAAGGSNTGRITAERAPWGLWNITAVERCISE